jgi:hypothetical protein
MHGEAEDQPLRWRISPGRRIVGLEPRTADVESVGGIEWDRPPTRRLTPLNAVVVAAALYTLHVEAVDHARVAISDE